MKRAAALIELSREHHAALALALHTRRAALAGGETAEAMAATVIERYRSELRPHFEEEERTLLAPLRQAGETALIERLRNDHDALTAMVRALTAQGDRRNQLLAFADRLAAHVRFEEREFFPVLERCWTEQALAAHA